jgi:hypothetical protein
MTRRRSQPPLALAFPQSRFTSRVGGGSAFFRRHSTLMRALFCIFVFTLLVGCATHSNTSPSVASFRFIDSTTTLLDVQEKVGSPNGGMAFLMSSHWFYNLSDGSKVQIDASNSDGKILDVLHKSSNGDKLYETIYIRK